jgi:hydrogenase-4 component E
MGFGRSPSDVAQVFAGAMLLLSFALLQQRHVARLVSLYALQAGVLAAACAWQGWMQGAPALFLVALLTLCAKTVAIPAALRRLARPVAPPLGGEASAMMFASLLIGVALVALSIAVVLPIEPVIGAPTRENFALALSVVWLGALAMVSHGAAPARVVGFLSMENGLILTAIGVPDMTLLVGLTIASLLLVASAVFVVLAWPVAGSFWTPRLRHPNLRLRAGPE